MYISLYRRYRPQTFSDVVGQSAAIGVITRAVENGTIGHAYLFSGPRGCGKTTIARLFAKAVNCPNRRGAEPCNECETCLSIVEGSCLDVIEIDGASNNSVDEIRDLKEHVALASFTCPYKVYIIDEVHMLSISAFNALLKTLEEPPERVIFILATTAPHKVPVTIRSRCQHIPFHGMTPEQIVSRLAQVAAVEGIEVQNEALWEIARNSEGGMRDALSLMEQAIAYGTDAIRRETIDKLLGGGSSTSIRQWLSLCLNKPEDSLPHLESMFRSGAVPERFLGTLFTCIRNLWLQSRWGEKVLSSLMLSDEEKIWLKTEKNSFSTSQLERLMSQIASLIPQARRGISNDVLCGLLIGWLLAGDSFPFPETPTVLPISVNKESDAPPRPASKSDGRSFTQQRSEPPAVHRNLQDHSEKKAPEVSPVSDISARSPAGAPSHVDELTVSDDSLKQFLLREMATAPQTILPLLLTDIVCDKANNAFSLCLDVQDMPAYENLKDERTLRSVAAFLKQAGFEVDSIAVFCGEQSKCLQDIAAEYMPVSEVHTLHPLQTAEDRNTETKAAISQNDYIHSPVNESHEQTVTNELQSSPLQIGNESLHVFLRSFSDGSLLYCRPNEETSGSDEGEES